LSIRGRPSGERDFHRQQVGKTDDAATQISRCIALKDNAIAPKDNIRRPISAYELIVE
jgi:hypothetical protein